MAESTDAKALFETGLPVRDYLPLRDVRLEHLVPTEVTQGAYNGAAIHWSARIGDTFHPVVAWTYGATAGSATPRQSGAVSASTTSAPT